MTDKQEFKLKGGVLIVGSLYWQDHLKEDKKDNARKNWREQHLNMDEVLDIAVPIKYGRFSTASGETYTMVFDKNLRSEEYGKAKAVPFKKSTFSSFEEIKSEVRALSRVEGPGSTFIKGTQSQSAAWCVCGIVFNPKVNLDLKRLILSQWQKELEENPSGNEVFQKNTELYSANYQGELLIDWPNSNKLDKLDFLIATSTKPKIRKEATLNPEEIARYIGGRNYFYRNIKSGITTYQDNDIRSLVKSRHAFRLLAIRPLEGAQDTEALKVLKMDQVYPFYQFYTFSNDGSEITRNEDSFLDFYRIRTTSKDIPVNISAIVGANGTGKSTLLELIFRAVYNIACKGGLLKEEDTGKLYKEGNLFLDVIYQLSDGIYRLRLQGSDIFLQLYEVTGGSPNKYTIQQPTQSHSWKKESLKSFFYSVAVNYSHYGLK